MLVGSMHDMPGSSTIKYVDKATKKLAAKRNLLPPPMLGCLTALNEIRKARGLNSIVG